MNTAHYLYRTRVLDIYLRANAAEKKGEGEGERKGGGGRARQRWNISLL